MGTAAVGGGLTGAAYAKNVRSTPGSARPRKLWNAATFQEWQERMVGLGTLGRMGGSPALDRWTDMVEQQLQISGLSTIRDPQVMGPSQQSWTPTGWSLKVTNDHGYGPTKIPVASFYPYPARHRPGGSPPHWSTPAPAWISRIRISPARSPWSRSPTWTRSTRPTATSSPGTRSSTPARGTSPMTPATPSTRMGSTAVPS
jgi:hypothetical protein